MISKFFPRRWYFVLVKGSGPSQVVFYLTREKANGKFKCRHYIYSGDMFNWFQAHWIMLQFMLPAWIRKNGSMFDYVATNGKVQLWNYKKKK